jgi:hypothetical protein
VLSKHRRQMSPAEIRFAETTVHAVDTWCFDNDHLLQRMQQKQISKKDAVLAAKYGEVIRVQDDGRVVMRLMRPTQPFATDKVGTVVCVSLLDKTIVTAWHNDPKDNHMSAGLDAYTWQVNVIEYLRSIQ